MAAIRLQANRFTMIQATDQAGRAVGDGPTRSNVEHIGARVAVDRLRRACSQHTTPSRNSHAVM